MATKEVKKLTQLTVEFNDVEKATTFTVGQKGVSGIFETDTHFIIWYGDEVGHAVNRSHVREFDFTLTTITVEIPEEVLPPEVNSKPKRAKPELVKH